MRALILTAVLTAAPALACVQLKLVPIASAKNDTARPDAKPAPDKSDTARPQTPKMPPAPEGYEWKAIPCGEHR